MNSGVRVVSAKPFSLLLFRLCIFSSVLTTIGIFLFCVYSCLYISACISLPGGHVFVSFLGFPCLAFCCFCCSLFGSVVFVVLFSSPCSFSLESNMHSRAAWSWAHFLAPETAKWPWVEDVKNEVLVTESVSTRCRTSVCCASVAAAQGFCI